MESGLGELSVHFENNGLLVGCNGSPFKYPKNPKLFNKVNMRNFLN